MDNNLNEEQILAGLFEATERLPEKTVTIKRLGMEITLRGLTAKQVDSTRERCTYRNKVRGKIEEKLEMEQFNALLITESTVGLKVKTLTLGGWGDQRILSQYKLSGPDEAIRRVLLAGEMAVLADEVLDISGFNEGVEDIKN